MVSLVRHFTDDNRRYISRLRTVPGIQPSDPSSNKNIILRGLVRRRELREGADVSGQLTNIRKTRSADKYCRLDRQGLHSFCVADIDHWAPPVGGERLLHGTSLRH